MKNKLLLSIAMSSAINLNTNLACAASTENNDNLVEEIVSIEREETHSGKCASGKCGTLKAYEESVLTHDPQCRLVQARDGKCGITGKGVVENTKKAADSKCASGVCGQ